MTVRSWMQASAHLAHWVSWQKPGGTNFQHTANVSSGLLIWSHERYYQSMAGKIPEPFRDPHLAVSGEVAGFYPREFYVCDNFASFQVELWGRLWPTSEHAYQASHFFETAPELAEKIALARSAHDAYKLAKANAGKAPANWEEVKLGIMEEIVRAKLSQHFYIQEKILQTGEVEIVEDSPKDSFWGWGADHKGQNQLGKTWMKLRKELVAGKIPRLPKPDYTF